MLKGLFLLQVHIYVNHWPSITQPYTEVILWWFASHLAWDSVWILLQESIPGNAVHWKNILHPFNTNPFQI